MADNSRFDFTPQFPESIPDLSGASNLQIPSDVLNAPPGETPQETTNLIPPQANFDFQDDLIREPRAFPQGGLRGFITEERLESVPKPRFLRPRAKKIPIVVEDFLDQDSTEEERRRKLGALLGGASLRGLTGIEQIPSQAGGSTFRRPAGQPRSFSFDRLRRENDAHYRRQSRLTRGELGQAIDNVRRDPDVNDIIVAFDERSYDFARGTARDDERHRELTPLIAAVTSEPAARAKVKEGLRADAVAKSDSLKRFAREKRGLYADAIIVGGGVHGATMAAKMLALDPSRRVIVVDNHVHLGGQFGSYGERPVFTINSRNRPQDLEKPGLPGQLGNLNSLGEKAPVQISDLTNDTYPTNLSAADAAEWDLALSMDGALLDTEAIGIKDAFNGDNPNVTLKAIDKVSGDELSIYGPQLILAGGIGERPKQAGVYTAADFLGHFGNIANKFPMDAFRGKRGAIIGCGDNARVVARLLAGLGPSEAYGYSKMQFSLPDGIVWYGADFSNSETFCDTNRSAYTSLKPFITNQLTPVANQFLPVQRRVSNLITENNGRVRVSLQPKAGANAIENLYDNAEFDFVVDCRPLVDTYANLLDGASPEDLRVRSATTRIGGQAVFAAVGREYGPKVLLGGAGANLPLTDYELSTYSDLIQENTKSMWAQVPRAERLMEIVDDQLRARL